MEENRFHFFLPRLLSKGLIEDNSSHYSLPSFPHDVAVESCATLMKYISMNLETESISTTSKKRIKFLMEILSVTLSMPVSSLSISLIESAIQIYIKWLSDLSFFGGQEKQNEYLRLIVTQLSLPFDFKIESKATVDDKQRFTMALDTVLDIIQLVYIMQSISFEEETWNIFIRTLIGICDSLVESVAVDDELLAPLRRKGIEVLFSAIQMSGLQNQEIWATFVQFSQQWNTLTEFVEAWGKNVSNLFNFLNCLIYDLPTIDEESPFNGGYYQKNSVKVETQTVAWIFNQMSMAFNSTGNLSAPLQTKLSNVCFSLASTAISVATSYPSMISRRFPSLPFLKLFGRFLSIPPDSEEYNEAVSKTIETILLIVSNFDQAGAETPLTGLISAIAKRIDNDHMLNTLGYLNQGIEAFGCNLIALPYLSELVINSIPSIKLGENSPFQTKEFFNHLQSVFVSASEVLHKDKSYSKKIEDSFTTIWSLTHSFYDIKFALICYAYKLNVPFIQHISEYLKLDEFIKLCGKEESIDFVSSCISFLGSVIKTNNKIINEINSHKIIEFIEVGIRNVEPNVKLTISVLILLNSLVEWSSHYFTNPEPSNAFVKIVKTINGQLSSLKDGALKKLWSESNISTAETLIQTTESRFMTHIPCNDFFSHILDSSSDINEETLTIAFGISNYKTHYYTVGDSLLITFIEQPDGKNPMALFARGPFGKSIWKVNDNFVVQIPEIHYKGVNLPPAEKLIINPIGSQGASKGPIVDIAKFEEIDNRVRDKFAKEYQNPSKCDAFHAESAYTRPRVADFLVQTGLLDCQNVHRIRPQTDKAAVKSTIEALNLFENLRTVNIPVIHVLPGDMSIEDTVKHQRKGTSKLQNFLKGLCEPVFINDKSAANHGLPLNMNSTIPLIPASAVSGLVVSPAMAKDDTGSNAIFELSKNSLIKIIFNETNSPLNLPPQKEENGPKQIVLVVKPTLNGLYHVWLKESIGDGANLPFTEQQTLTAKSIAFYLSVCIDLLFGCGGSADLLPNLPKLRKDAISLLCKEESKKELAAIVANAFKK